MAEKLRICISIGDGMPRIFTRDVSAPIADVERAVDAGVISFNESFNKSLERARRAHSARVLREVRDGDRAA